MNIGAMGDDPSRTTGSQCCLKRNLSVAILGRHQAFFANTFGTGREVRPATDKEKVLVVIRELLV
jgi:hypothetical protein